MDLWLVKMWNWGLQKRNYWTQKFLTAWIKVYPLSLIFVGRIMGPLELNLFSGDCIHMFTQQLRIRLATLSNEYIRGLFWKLGFPHVFKECSQCKLAFLFYLFFFNSHVSLTSEWEHSITSNLTHEPSLMLNVTYEFFTHSTSVKLFYVFFIKWWDKMKSEDCKL